jgi:hypothetical protein
VVIRDFFIGLFSTAIRVSRIRIRIEMLWRDLVGFTGFTQGTWSDLVNLLKGRERPLLLVAVASGPIGLNQTPPGDLIVRAQASGSLQ